MNVCFQLVFKMNLSLFCSVGPVFSVALIHQQMTEEIAAGVSLMNTPGV